MGGLINKIKNKNMAHSWIEGRDHFNEAAIAPWPQKPFRNPAPGGLDLKVSAFLPRTGENRVV